MSEGSGEVEMRWRNFYRCPRCGHEWEDCWDCQCDDDCAKCGCRHISPYESEEIDSPTMHVKVEKMFTCPRCGGHRLEEVMHSVFQSSPVLDIEVEDTGEAHIVEYGDASFDDGEVSHYQCLDCGEALECEPSDQSLYEYLHKMQKGKA